jgi:hypothetical protein
LSEGQFYLILTDYADGDESIVRPTRTAHSHTRPTVRSCGSRAYQPRRTYADTPRDFSSIHTLSTTTVLIHVRQPLQL